MIPSTYRELPASGSKERTDLRRDISTPAQLSPEDLVKGMWRTKADVEVTDPKSSVWEVAKLEKDLNVRACAPFMFKITWATDTALIGGNCAAGCIAR